MTMYKLIALLLICPAFFLGSAQAQFRKIPGEVTDAFRKQYPNATGATWSDKISYFQAEFKLDSGAYLARYDKTGQWKGSERTITADQLPPAVKDGYDKSIYTDTWQVKEYTVLYKPGNVMEYRLLVRKSGIQKKYLYFNASGKMLEGTSTL
ncbi:putative PepSY-like beta-lactamase-inhibitor [Dinghuibacter silviterrae]|uniref:Putative PepSY-like beta-lactamase-inhibitor n=2 Tax=Dinghuibacter silviterrae TaxID=1539049 RepID=A0A4R8DTF8_9BACT|nr:putative PepSY-like beta-lactamase-inhibitor [Dinghuibacter silviterrae]